MQDPSGRTLYSRQPDLALIPASTLKLVVAAVALAKIGPDTRFVTDVRAASAPAAAGTVGDLWLVGGGDPLLSTADFAVEGGYMSQARLATPMEALADKVVAAGVRHVGRVVGDDSRYDAQRSMPTWLPRYLTNFEISPLSALTVNKGFLTFEPPTAVTPSQATHAATVLSDLLKARGVAVDGAAAEGVAPAGTVTVTSIESPPLAEVVGETLQHSDNLAAEMLVKELGSRFGGAGSTAAGLEVVRRHLSETGLPADELTAADGSGLDRSDRVTCDLLQQLLVTSGEGGALDKALPVAGGNGTLHRRFVEHAGRRQGQGQDRVAGGRGRAERVGVDPGRHHHGLLHAGQRPADHVGGDGPPGPGGGGGGLLPAGPAAGRAGAPAGPAAGAGRPREHRAPRRSSCRCSRSAPCSCPGW